ncbi:MAG: O-antigen ligase family protein [Deltaproteobacteria bacterium]|jgi:hypothetical protein|nr:O-antigen ligase family protein [Deltaproteobacteria bacterium]
MKNRLETWKWLPAFLIFSVIPLTAVPLFIDPYIQSKNAILSILYLLGFSIVARDRFSAAGFSLAGYHGILFFGFALFLSTLANLDTGFHWPFWLESVSYFAGFLYFGALVSDARFWPRFQSAVLFSATGVLLVHFYQLSMAFANETLDSRRDYASTFGENNLLSQYLVMAFASLLTMPGRFPSFIRTAVVTVIFFNQSRSAIIGVLLLIAWQFYRDRKTNHAINLAVGAGLALCISHIAQTRLPEQTHSTFRDFSSWQVRYEVAKESLDLVRSSPFGVGPDRFQFASVSYFQDGKYKQSDRELFTNPHSEVLRLATSGGWLLAIAGLALVVQMIRLLRTVGQRKPVSVLLLIALIPEILFQFPFDIGTTVSFFLVASAAVVVTLKQNSESRWLWTLVSICSAMLFAMGNLALLYSGYLARHAKTTDQAVSACLLNPWHWQTCELAILRLEEEANFSETKVLIDDQLRRYPNNFLALRHRSRFHFANGNVEAGCEVLKAEAQLMKGGFTAAEFSERHCVH